MATATFFTSAKRHNSTLIPTGGTVLNVSLKNGCDLLAPTFYLDYASVPTWSMMQFAGRYYFITGITSLRQDYWQIDAEVDVLATYKADIQATTAFVLYDATANSELVDNRLPIVTTPTIGTSSAQFSPYYAALGTFILTAINADGCKSYCMSGAQLRSVMGQLQNWISGEITLPTDIIEAVIEVGQFLVGSGNIMNNIKGVTWVPFDYSSFVGSAETVKIGLYDQSSVSVGAIGTGFQTFSWTQRLDIPWSFSDWRRNSPYTQIYAYIPYIGSILISPCNAINDSSLDFEFSVNKLTGALAVEVHGATSGETFFVGSGTTGCNIPVGVSGFNAATAVAGAFAAASSIMAGDIVGAAKNAYNGIQSNAQSAGAIAGGAGAGLNQNVILKTVSHDVSTAPNSIAATIGTPTFAQQSLSGKTGYVQTRDVSVSGSMTDTERQRINQLLDGGIYIE